MTFKSIYWHNLYKHGDLYTIKMRVEISKEHLRLNNRLTSEVNKFSGSFSKKDYSKIGETEKLLLRRDISVEGKKSILVKKLHDLTAKTFSINKARFGKSSFELMKTRLLHILRLTDKLRSINHYLETTFFEDLKAEGIRVQITYQNAAKSKALARDELQALEYTAYRLIAEAVMLDKTLLKEYSRKEEKIMRKDEAELKDIHSILAKESELLEHIQAKIPTAKAAGTHLIKEPVFSHWASRVFALLAYFEHLYLKERQIFRKLKKNKHIKSKIEKKIAALLKERAKLVQIMEQKIVSMEKFNIGGKFKKELRNLTTIINV